MEAAQVAVLDVNAGTWKSLIPNASQAQYVSSGHLVYVAGEALWAVAFDLSRLEPTGVARVVVPQILMLPTGTAEFDVARDGTLVYVMGGGAASRRRLVWVDRGGRQEEIPPCRSDRTPLRGCHRMAPGSRFRSTMATTISGSGIWPARR